MIIIDLATPCTQKSQRIVEIIEKFLNLNIPEIVQNVMTNYMKIIVDGQDFMAQLEISEYAIAGKDAGDIIVLTFLFNPTTTVKFSPENATQVIYGLLDGMGIKLTANITKCINGSTDLMNDIADIINMTMHLHIRNITEILAIVKKLMKTAEDVLVDIKPCMESSKDLDIIIQKFKNQTWDKTIKQFTKYSIFIAMDLVAIIKDIQESKYFDLGNKFGDMLNYIVLKDS